MILSLVWLLFAVTALAGCMATGSGKKPPLLQGTVLTRDGQRLVLTGASAYLVPFYLAATGERDIGVEEHQVKADPDATAWLRTMRERGFNTVRIPLTWQSSVMRAYGYEPEEYARTVEKLVREADHLGLNVLLCWFDSAGMGSDLIHHYKEAFPAMKEVYDRVRNVPGVMIEPFNEPNDMSWSSWLTIMGDTVSFLRKDLEYRGVVVVDTIDYSWSFSPGPAGELQAKDRKLLGSEQPQVLFANHRYANTSECFCGREKATWERNFGAYTRQFPLLGGEYGNFNEGMGPTPRWVDEIFDHLVGTSVPNGLNGVLAFLWHWNDANTMTQDDGRTLTEFGTQVVTALERIPRSLREPGSA